MYCRNNFAYFFPHIAEFFRKSRMPENPLA